MFIVILSIVMLIGGCGGVAGAAIFVSDRGCGMDDGSWRLRMDLAVCAAGVVLCSVLEL